MRRQRDDGKLIVGESKEAGGASSVAFAVQQDAPNAKGDGANANGNGTSSLSEEKEREGREKRAREVRAERERETAERERRERREMGERMLQQAQAIVPGTNPLRNQSRNRTLANQGRKRTLANQGRNCTLARSAGNAHKPRRGIKGTKHWLRAMCCSRVVICDV